MDELRTYADRRLELGDMIRAALHLARGLKDAQAENRARDLLSRLAGDTFQLAVAGQFSRGKTTLMNALLGGPYLPMGALQMRQAADWFRQCVQTAPSDEDLAAADSLMAWLRAFQAALEDAGPPALTQPWTDQESPRAR